jgi:hypothetical protein
VKEQTLFRRAHLVTFTALETTQRIEEANIIHLTQQVKECAGLFPEQTIAAQSVGGGVTAVT